MAALSTIDELEAALGKVELGSMQLSFGPAASPLRHGQWFANLRSDGDSQQAYGTTLADALSAALGLQAAQEVVSERPKATPPPAPRPTAPTALGDLLS